MHILEYLKDNETIGFYIEGENKTPTCAQAEALFQDKFLELV